MARPTTEADRANQQAAYKTGALLRTLPTTGEYELPSQDDPGILGDAYHTVASGNVAKMWIMEQGSYFNTLPKRLAKPQQIEQASSAQRELMES